MTAAQQAASAHGMVDGEFLLTSKDFHSISGMLLAETGIALHEGKATLLYSRLGKRLRALGLTAFAEYCALLDSEDSGEERGRMIRALTTNVTRFFREPHHFTYLRSSVLPDLVRFAEGGGRVRIWSAACSTGQEPYSLALTILGLCPKASQMDIRILATDLDTAVLDEAKAGCYAADALESVPPDALQRWFERTADGWRVGADMRRLIAFRPLNLIKPWPVKGPFDAIMCRNVVIYFNEAQQQAIWSRFQPLLTPTGLLFIGHSERVTGPATAHFESVGITIYQRRRSA